MSVALAAAAASSRKRGMGVTTIYIRTAAIHTCFVPYYAQRISHAIVMNGAAGILSQIKKKSAGSGLGGRACGAL